MLCHALGRPHALPLCPAPRIVLAGGSRERAASWKRRRRRRQAGEGARTSITKIFTKSSPFGASASAQPRPQMPTHTLRTARAHTCSGRERCGHQEPRRHA